VFEDKISTSNHPTFEATLKAFLAKFKDTEKYPTHACIGVAGPKKGNMLKVTNAPWPEFDIEKLKIEMKFVELIILNDFEANGYGVLAMQPGMYTEVNKVAPVAGKPKVCIGTGTGLGEAILTQDPSKGQYVVYPGEGGHVDFAARNQIELGLLEHVRKKIKGLDHISYERCCCGLSIPLMYDFLHSISKEPDTPFHGTIKVRLEELLKILAVDPEENSITKRVDELDRMIFNAGLDKTDPICVQSVELFANLYGSETGNLALKILPYGGIYLLSTITQVLKKHILTEKTFIVNICSLIIGKLPS
jgi:glucokinase